MKQVKKQIKKKCLIVIPLIITCSITALFITTENTVVVHKELEEVQEIDSANEIVISEHRKIEQDIGNDVTRGCIDRETLVLPDSADGEVKTYMDYRHITDTSSEQYKLQEQSYTDEYGYRRVNDYYVIALGSAYGTKIGTKYLITLDTGLVFPVVLGDCKADIHTDPSNKYIPHNGNIAEFIVDTQKLEQMAKTMGDVSYGGFEGSIVGIERISSIDE